MREPDPKHFEHPRSTEEVIELINAARKDGKAVRVCGSAHSSERAIYTDGFTPENVTETRDINVMVDKLNHIEFEERDDPDNPKVKIRVVRVGAGVFLGPDPVFAGATDERDNLIKALRERGEQGLALDVVGGITHQTVGGFVSTGSAGASVKFDFGAAILEISVVDGNGMPHTYQRSRNGEDKSKNPFYAFGVSMGLLGVITEVVLKVADAFDVEGTVTTSSSDDCEIDLFGAGNGKPSLEQFLSDTQYARLLWWPQKGVDLMQVWKCQRTSPKTEHVPHQQFEHPLLDQHLIQLLYQGLLPALANRDWKRAQTEFEKLKVAVEKAMSEGSSDVSMPSPEELQAGLQELATIVATAKDDSAYESALALIIPMFMKTEQKQFNDTWWNGIPDDNQVSDKLVPATFTELWVPLSRATELMSDLRDLYESLNPWQRGSFCVEIYAGPPSEFWLSPAYGTDPVLRVDVFVLEDGPEWKERDTFYAPYWKLLSKFEARFHWGKRLSPIFSPTGVPYRRAVYGTRLQRFLELRETHDPDGVFLTEYWREHLGIDTRPQGLQAL